MDLGVAVDAGPVEHKPAGRHLRCRRMAGLYMAALAQPGAFHAQQRGMVGAVRRMAVHAVFGDRRMFEEKWSPFFRVALIAVFIDRIGGQELLGCRSMRVMATGAIQFAFPYGHVAGALDLRLLEFMALETRFGRAGPDQKVVVRAGIVDAVAGSARYVLGVVGAAPPGKMRAFFVAGQAGAVFLVGCGRLRMVKPDERFGIVRVLRMPVSIAVAGSAH